MNDKIKAVLAIVGTLIFLVAVWSAVPARAESASNQAMKHCLQVTGYTQDNFDTFDWSKAAKCHSDYRVGVQKAEYAEMRDFLKHNPRYRVPGQCQNRCWGKPREMAFESAWIKQDGMGFSAGVNYKDTLPAGCYENGPWDNRNAN